MEKFDLKKHNMKMMTLAKNSTNGTYPSRKVAKTGSYIGISLGVLLVAAGGIGTIAGRIWGIGSLLAGGTTVASNIFNLRRMSRPSDAGHQNKE